MASGLLDFLFGQKVLRNAAGATPVDNNYSAAPNDAAARNAAYAAQRTQQVTPGNLDLSQLPAIKNPDGSMARRTMVVPGKNGQSMIIPLVGPQGQLLSQQDAIKFYMGQGKHLGVFKTPEAADAYNQTLK